MTHHNLCRSSAAAIACCALVLAMACSKEPASSSQPAPQAGASASTAAAPPVMPAGAQPGVQTISGEVLETMDASTYTYVRVKSDRGEVWAATAKMAVAVGDRVVVPLESEMRNFHSPSLNRDFPVIYFVSQISREGAPAQPAPPPMAVGHGGSAAPSAAATVAVKPMAAPPGGSTIADVWANRAKLSGKNVTVNGTVVKFNGDILGRNWLHLQDGSGKAAEGTHDLCVTTDTAERRVKPGDVVTVTGTVAVDKDFTAGYTYKVMLEGGKIRTLEK